jgi:hypothetical protein
MGTKTRKLNDIDVDEYLATTVSIEPLALEEEFIKMPADLAYWNERYAEAVRGFLTAKIGRERIEARLHIEIRETLAAKGDKKGPTIADIEAGVSTHPEMIAARDAEIMAEVEKVRLAGVIDAVRAKRDMLVQLGARARIELENDPVIREQARVAHIQREGL